MGILTVDKVIKHWKYSDFTVPCYRVIQNIFIEELNALCEEVRVDYD